MIPNFAIDQNLKVEFLVPDAEGTTFILGISELGGTDTLGGFGEFVINVSLLGGDDVLAPSSGLKWQDSTCSVARANISVGGQLQDSVFFQPEPATANLTLQSFDLDPTVNKNIRASTKFRVRLEDDEIDRILFQGFIDTINVTYYPQGPNLIQITGFDAYKSLVNSRFAVWDTTSFGSSISDDETWELIGIYSGLGLSPESVHLGGRIPTVNETNVQVSSVVNDALTVGNGLVWLNQDTEELYVIHRPGAIARTYSPGETVNTNRVIFSTVASNAPSWILDGSGQNTGWFSGRPYPSTLALRRRRTSAGTGTQASIKMRAVEPMPIVEQGKTYTFSCYVFCQYNTDVNLEITFFDDSGNLLSTVTDTASLLPANTTQRRSITALAPATAARAIGGLFYTQVNTELLQFFEFSSPMLEEGSTPTNYFDGNTMPDTGPGFTYQWTGTPQRSSSVKKTLVLDPITGYYVIGNNHGDDLHLCMSEINVFSDADAVYNSLTVSLTSDPATFVTRQDQDSIDLYGESAIDIAINTTSLAELDNWADRVFNHKSANQVNMVQTPAIDRLGTLTEAAVFTPGMTVGVSYTKDQLNIVGFYTIIKVSHRIDVDNWFTTLELWKEA
jgi:hypothetical protein